ncbi:hypothetical protein ABZZ79_03325 [Streptomyces sp. NPDC006458]|uniref:hypothetical protein n=1 Tax=Streptomyces sp. NPDC006458 TaxID=3154302 RepID=UPI0033BA353C
MERTDEPDPPPSLKPQPSGLMATPDTPEQCHAEYENGADIRRRLGWRDGN